jgi:uncharacterized membrane protein YadS
MRFRPAHFIVLAAVGVSFCGSSAVQPSELTSEALVRALQQQGATVTRAGSLPQSSYPFLSVSAQLLQVNGADVQVFEYASATRADSDASKVSPTGSPIGQSQVSWMDTPHFYKRDRLIVLYVGHSADLLRMLEAVVGAAVAAGR